MAGGCSGFSLLELLVVLVIMVLLVFIAIPHYRERKNEAMAQEAFLQLSQWADVCVLRAIRAYETTHPGETPLYPTVPEIPEDGHYFHYSHGSGSVENVLLTATGLQGDLLGRTLTVHVRVRNGYPSKKFGGSLY